MYREQVDHFVWTFRLNDNPSQDHSGSAPRTVVFKIVNAFRNCINNALCMDVHCGCCFCFRGLLKYEFGVFNDDPPRGPMGMVVRDARFPTGGEPIKVHVGGKSVDAMLIRLNTYERDYPESVDLVSLNNHYRSIVIDQLMKILYPRGEPTGLPIDLKGLLALDAERLRVAHAICDGVLKQCGALYADRRVYIVGVLREIIQAISEPAGGIIWPAHSDVLDRTTQSLTL